tara:strand:+ start:1437 stop:1619 length:183 start_codon:yes stop_codon:yes gene_type:complete
MAIDKEVKLAVEKIINEMKLSSDFQNMFIRYLEYESELETNDDERARRMDLLKKEILNES